MTPKSTVFSAARPLNAFLATIENPETRRGRKKGALAGVPVAVKDLIGVAGVTLTGGSAILKGHHCTRDATVVKRLRDAGAVIIGKTNTHEFAYGTTNDNPHYGATRNPWNLDLSTGGSSGGSAALVGAGLLDLALGTDTAGSIRIPAALCGAVGLKPTTGVVPTTGVIPLSRTLDCVGPIASSVAMARRAFEVLSGEKAPKRRVKGLTIGVAEDFVFDRVHPDVERRVREALAVCEKLGCTVKTIRLSELFEAARVGIAITRAEAAAWHRKWFPARAAEYGADVRAKLEAGTRLPALEYLVAQEDRERLQRALRRTLRGVDVLAGPTTPMPAFRNAVAPVNDTYRLTYPYSVGFLPAVTVPCGLTGDGLPVGFQIGGPPHAEMVILALAEAYEAARGPLAKCPFTGHN